MQATLNFSSQSSFSCKLPPSAAAAIDNNNKKSLYQVLRVKRNASQTEIKTAYRTLAKLYHPDATLRFMESSIASSHDFIQIHNAYATLSDPNARAAYDFNFNDDSRRRWINNNNNNNACLSRFYPTQRWETDQCW